MLCNNDTCWLPHGHTGAHQLYASSAWAFLGARDKAKLDKAGFATPRGGAKGAYQNHVRRSNRVIVPFERLGQAPLAEYEDGYVIRLFPEQYFESAGTPKAMFSHPGAPAPGADAFILYRTHAQLADFPPLPGWAVRSLTLNGQPIAERTAGAVDHGEYVVRIAPHGAIPGRNEGPPQGIFAPEYANAKTNYLSKCILAWLTAHTVDSPYTAVQCGRLEEILTANGVFNPTNWEASGLLRSGFTACPLCLRLIKYDELHDQISYTDESSLMNAAEQVVNSTRSTIANLSHMIPLNYLSIEHVPGHVAWGHANCNTRLGQRRCYPIPELIAVARKVGWVAPDGNVTTFGWASPNLEMIRSSAGSVWIRIVEDHLSDGDQAALVEYLQIFETVEKADA